jgi:hypothetical protein
MLGWPLPISMWPGIALHVLSAVFLFLAPSPGKGYFKPTRHWGEPLFVIGLMLPAFGWVLAGWIVLVHHMAPFDKDAYIFENENSGVDDANPLAGIVAESASQKNLADALDVVPAVDALLSADPGMKRGAIETLARIQTVEAIGWLQKARSENDPEVRFYATTALTRLKAEFETAIRAAEREVYKKPGELEPRVWLQRVRYEYAVSGMLDFDARKLLLEQARSSLEAPSERSAAAARLLFLVEKELNPQGAFKVLDYLESILPKQRNRWLRERAVLFFSLGRFAELRKLLSANRLSLIGKEGVLKDRQWHAVLSWWTNE